MIDWALPTLRESFRRRPPAEAWWRDCVGLLLDWCEEGATILNDRCLGCMVNGASSDPRTCVHAISGQCPAGRYIRELGEMESAHE